MYQLSRDVTLPAIFHPYKLSNSSDQRHIAVLTYPRLEVDKSYD